MNRDDTSTGFPSDTASLPSPPFLVWVVVLTVLVCVWYTGYYVVWETLFGSSTEPGIIKLIHRAAISPSSAGSLYADISNVITPHPLSILILAILVGGYRMYVPYVWSTIQWAWMTITGKRLSDRTTAEGFLVSPSGNPEVTGWVITRRDLLDRLRRRVFQINPPHGIRCGTSSRRDAPYWEPSSKLVHLYLKRVANMYPVPADPKQPNPPVSPKAEKIAIREIRHLCEERAIITEIIDTMEIDPTIQYSYRKAREHLTPLIAFYDKIRKTTAKSHPRRVVDDILGLPLGQRDPYNETEDNIVNSHRHMLPTQTNEIHQLDKMSSSIQYASNRELRGGNDATPVAPHLLLDS